jgi:hypothetical protein
MNLPRGRVRGSRRRFRAPALVAGLTALVLATGCRSTRPTTDRPCQYDPWTCPVPDPGHPRPPAPAPPTVPPAPPPPIPE